MKTMGHLLLSYPQVFLIFAAAINLTTFALYGIDKRRAQKHAWRISEACLLTLPFLGGALGALLGMSCFRHKTKHLRFRILIPLALLLYTAFFAACIVFALTA